ncbi:hypothetical protein JD844_013731 [Phrynosoma platyrhinos]|uniref:SCAN box domain-containing protein n=1 Tax=Phrynosoma platyrhinos TaxID=52577 RepID=A0ABQ7TM68_PHRPL|nr:hypothetical protein JD844_013731 [Phrynosoma platyrhinos]
MKEQNSARPQLEQGPQREGKASSAIQSEYMTERPKWRLSEQDKDLSGKRMQQRWEAQWQEFLKTLQSPYSGNLQLSETTPWDDTKAFLASFEQVAEACRWPQGEWVIRLLPALSGEAEQAFQNMASTDQEDYGKVKAAILRADALRMEMRRQHFRQFCCQEVEDPRRIHCQLQELCHRWLKPEKRSKEQILELLILEQFLASLPPDLQSWIRAAGPDTCSQAVALVEDFLMTQQGAESAKWQKPLQDVCVGSLEVEKVQSDAVQGQIYKEAKQAGDAEITLLGNGAEHPNHSSSLLPPEGQEVTEARLSEGLVNLKETGVSLHMVEQTLTQPGQQTMFWQVLQEDSGNVQPFGDEKRCWIKMEKSQQGDSLPKETHGVLTETFHWSIPMASEIHDHRYGSEGQQGEKPPEEQKESSELTQGFAGAGIKTSGMPIEGEKALLSKYGRKYKSDLVTYAGEYPVECLRWEEDMQNTSYLNPLQETLKGEKQQVISECNESRCWIKMEKSQQGETVPEETQKVLAETIQWNFPVTSEIHELKRDKKRNPIKMENAQQGEMRPEEIHRTCAETAKGNFVAVEILGQIWEPERQQRENPVRRENECTELSKDLTGAVSQTSTMHGTEEMSSFLQDEGGYSFRSGYMIHSREDSYECPVALKHFPEVTCFDKHQGLKVSKKENEVSEYIKKENLMGCPNKLSGLTSVIL